MRLPATEPWSRHLTLVVALFAPSRRAVFAVKTGCGGHPTAPTLRHSRRNTLLPFCLAQLCPPSRSRGTPEHHDRRHARRRACSSRKLTTSHPFLRYHAAPCGILRQSCRDPSRRRPLVACCRRSLSSLRAALPWSCCSRPARRRRCLWTSRRRDGGFASCCLTRALGFSKARHPSSACRCRCEADRGPGRCYLCRRSREQSRSSEHRKRSWRGISSRQRRYVSICVPTARLKTWRLTHGGTHFRRGRLFQGARGLRSFSPLGCNIEHRSDGPW